MSATTYLEQHDGQYRLIRAGQPYFVKGAAAYPKGMELVAKYGGNSVRMSPRDRALLDELERLGLSLLCHLPVRAERDGMDYSDAAAVAEQRRNVLDLVRAYRDHPAVLMWELGNELEWIPPGIKPNPAVWDEVNALAEEIHRLDSRPVLTVVGGINWNLKQLVRRCPALDLLGINAYGNLSDGRAWLDKNGWHKPYLVTEWGPTGWWQVPKTDFGLPIEETSTEKAERYRERYERDILGHPGRCLGSYVFLWKQHQEQTHTWFGMFDEDWRESESVDVMRYEWTGQWPEQRAPRVGPILIDGQPATASLRLAPGSRHQAVLTVLTPGDYDFHWEIVPENTKFGYGGQGETKPAPCGAVDAPFGAEVTFTTPEAPVAFRLFATVYDRHNHFTSANIPFLVEDLRVAMSDG